MNKVAVYGGLGNQMFQYAFCESLKKHGKSSRISFSSFFYFNHHNGFALTNAFNIKLQFPLNLMSFVLTRMHFIYRNRYSAFVFRNVIKRYHNLFYKEYKEKQEFVFDPEVYNQDSRMFRGIWQVVDYLDGVEQKIASDFSFTKPADEANMKLISQIENCNAVSLHIRRGDYLNSEWADILGVIKGMGYYERSVKYIKERVSDPHFFIFSDDINWVKDNLKLTECTYVDHNKGTDSYIDMYLMSLCKHNIIANSTFSWWGGWLNKNSEKIVIMPEKWINREACYGIFPENWIKLGVD